MNHKHKWIMDSDNLHYYCKICNKTKFIDFQDKIGHLVFYYLILLLGVLLVLDVISTFWAFTLGGVESNILLVYLSKGLGTSLEFIIGLSHSLALILLYFIMKTEGNKIKVPRTTILFLIIVNLLYIKVVGFNFYQIIMVI